MALDSVKMEIDRSAEEAVKAVKAETDAEIARINADADAKIASIRERENKRLEESIARLSRQEVSSTELESKKIVLVEKKEILEEAFAATLADLESAPKEKKLAQYKKMVEAVKQAIERPKAYMSPADSFKAADLGVSEIVKDERITGGLILESEDGSVQVDMQYKTILKTVWDREMKSLSDTLFG